jgi:cell division septal protein FtsQ
VSRLLTPRTGGRRLSDFGERSAFVGAQHLGRTRRVPGNVQPRPRSRGRLVRRVLVVLLVLAAVAGLVAAGAWLVMSPRFAVQAVDIRGTRQLTAERVLAAARIPPGRSVFLLDPRAIARGVESLPEVERAEVVRELPNHVTVVVEERRPFTLVHAGRLHWIDEGGHVIGRATQAVVPPAPVISGLSEAELLSMKAVPHGKARDAIRLIRALLRSGSVLAGEISEIDVGHADGPVLYTGGGVEVRLGPDEWEERLARLEAVLAQRTAREGGLRMVDLRFRDQVVLQGGR